MQLYHISENPGIEIFEPRPSPQYYDNIKGNTVFAVSGKMLHIYLLPRDCPRVCYYAKNDSLKADIDKYIGITEKKFIICTEENWLERIKNTKLYLYKMPHENFELLDEGAGYYVSYKTIKPINMFAIVDLMAELEKRNAELRVLPSLRLLAQEISNSSLRYSIIRLRNAEITLTSPPSSSPTPKESLWEKERGEMIQNF
ncbi:MAG TPA: hypothetical protein VG961_06945 [Ignavibacteria bacterium]|nr:hypothetical protein [Ignavibacteria bacterium]